MKHDADKHNKAGSIGFVSGCQGCEAEQAAQKALEALGQLMGAHEDHTWEQVGRCVYCADCSERLYQGRIPAQHTNVKKGRTHTEPAATRKMREMWNKND
jgi:hypothetical protein